jgi:ATP-dependent DNA helicase PIF1
MTLSEEQQRALDLMRGGRNVFLSGMAGTGKSTAFIEFLGSAFSRVDVTATTGIAALNLQDQFRVRAGVALPAYTVYRWSGIMLGPSPGQRFEDYFRFLQKDATRSRLAAFRRVQTAEVLAIDEISMLPGRIFDYLDYHFRKLRGVDKPFGGIQIIAVGDFLQLPPVAKDGRYDWAFKSRAWAEADFLTVFLQKIHRQDDPEFIAALNAFREGHISREVANTLANRVKMFVDRRVPRLLTHNVQVNKWNSYQLEQIDAPEVTITAETDGPEDQVEFLRKNLITPDKLALRVGARVMVTANISDPEFPGKLLAVNGSTGTVTALDSAAAAVLVKMDDGGTIQLARQTWRFDPQNEDSAAFAQVPLRLAYAMTIHKCQGLTLNRAMIDIRAAREPGQAYVALSRLRSLEGLFLKDWIRGVFVSSDAVKFYEGVGRE